VGNHEPQPVLFIGSDRTLSFLKGKRVEGYALVLRSTRSEEKSNISAINPPFLAKFMQNNLYFDA
jgi:hypothetical protein